MKEQRKIRNFLIGYHLQICITLKFVILAFLFALIGEILVYLVELPAMKTLSGGEHIYMPMLLFWYNIPLLLVILLMGIVITHRIAGPVDKIQQKLDHVIHGEDSTPIQLRQGDELRELADKINVLITRYQELRRTAKR